MTILKCDLCKKIIKKEPIRAGFGFLSRVELCHKCGAPVLEFLKKTGIIKMSESAKKKSMA